MKTKMSRDIDFTAIITAHNEGVVAHKTMLAVFEAIKKVESAGYSTEVVVHIDNGDEVTKKYFERYKTNTDVKIFENNFKDPGLSRNFAISRARGKIIGVVDADDLFTDNWYLEAIKAIKNHKTEIIAHPQYNMTFGNGTHVLWKMHNSKKTDDDKLILLGYNRWTSMCVAKKEIFLKHLYPKTENGYGHEDWLFNSEIEADGIEHKIIPNTMQFYRRSEKSVLTTNENANHIQWYSKLFDIKEMQKIISSHPEYLVIEKNNKRDKFLKKIHKTTTWKIVYRIKRKIIYTLNKNQTSKQLPVEIKEHWQAISNIEPRLFPYIWETNNVISYDSERLNVGKAYLKAIQNVTELPNIIFIVPWIVTGGADKVLLNYINAIFELHPDWHIAVISTLPSENTWKDKLPKNAYHVDFGNAAKGLDEYYKDLLFARILVQLRAKRIHLINSEYGYLWINKHKELFKNEYELTVSLFTYDYVSGYNDKAIFDYADPFLANIIDVTKNVYSDNKANIIRVVDKYGFDRKKFKVHYQPIMEDLTKQQIYKPGRTLRILWASRIAKQKCPELVRKIAEDLKHNNSVQIDMYGKLEDYKLKFFTGIPTIKYKGSYNGFSSLKTDMYDLYLYTSNADGMPNCILEATAAGLPIIASNIGGIKELITTGKTGILVEKPDDAKGYVDAIKEVLSGRHDLEKYVYNAQKLLQERHTWDVFVKNIKDDF